MNKSYIRELHRLHACGVCKGLPVPKRAKKKAMPTVSVDVEQRKSVVSAAVTHISIVTKQHDIVQLLFSLSVNETYERGILQ